MWSDFVLPEEFRRVFTPELLELTRCEGFVIAGGSVMAAGRFASTGHALTRDEDEDVDVFITSGNAARAVEAILGHQGSKISGQSRNGTLEVTNEHFSTLKMHFIPGRFGQTVQQVLSGFDVDCDAAALRVNEAGVLQLATLPTTKTSWETNVANVLSSGTMTASKLARIRGKGFSVSSETTEPCVCPPVQIAGCATWPFIVGSAVIAMVTGEDLRSTELRQVLEKHGTGETEHSVRVASGLPPFMREPYLIRCALDIVSKI